jgi:hypothetical protein
MKPSSPEFEKMIHQALRSLPDRRAPRSLESRVAAAIEARATLPWWKKSYADWPLAARCLFLLLSGGFAKVALMAAVWAAGDFDTSALVNAFATQFSWIERASSVVGGVGEFFAMVGRNLPTTWLYGGLAAIAVLYAALVGLGATAYRTLFNHR